MPVYVSVSAYGLQTFKLFDAYIDGNEKAGETIVKQTLFDILFTVGLSDELISRFAKSFGTGGLDWLRKARGLNLSSEVITNLSKLDDFADKMDEILELIKKSSHSADEVAECIIKHGDKALDAIRKYGDDAFDAIVRHGEMPQLFC